MPDDIEMKAALLILFLFACGGAVVFGANLWFWIVRGFT
jgi:hypothetical protein